MKMLAVRKCGCRRCCCFKCGAVTKSWERTCLRHSRPWPIALYHAFIVTICDKAIDDTT